MEISLNIRAATLACMLLLPHLAFASCGSAFCVINTGAEAQDAWLLEGTRVDLRFEYIKQDTVQSGTEEVGPSGEPGEHDEISTYNRNWRLAVDHNFSENWGVTLIVPYVDRDHSHLYNPPPAEQPADPEPESWRIRSLGDLRVIGRYQTMLDDQQRSAAGVRAGLTLPTGSTDERNDDGELAERTLQPGTGSVNIILGGFYRGPLTSSSDWFTTVSLQSPLSFDNEFRPGTAFGVDVGARVPLAYKLSGQLQVNYTLHGRDSGDQSEPADSGGSFIYISPGLSMALNQQWSIYAFAQVPVYQRVNGRQLTADTGVAVGASLML
jgi:hypothetical protein